MAEFVCTMCGFSYREERGRPGESIAPGTVWKEIPDGWVCPMCGSPKNIFRSRTDGRSVARADGTSDRSDTMAKYECTNCGYIYDEEKEGVKFADLPDDWVCPECGAEKSEFELVE